MLRHTRALLRRYRAQGVLDQPLAEREPRVVWVELSDRERALYDRIEEYIAEFYTRLERERPGLGFVMTVYRRRLTSSFAAVRLSLQRRLEFLSRQRADVGLTEEDLGEADLDRDVSEQLAAMDWTAAEGLAEEIGYLRGFLAELDALSGDSKRERLAAVLEELFAEVETVAVFTEYYDTLVDLREALAAVYGRSVACYSGRGGELWQDGEWRPVGRAELAALFRAGRVRVLLCTDAASEGLNLQTCGALVNYDLPWNPMRVEQRIGRFDRIGQRYRRVRIVHMLYRDTVEAEIYRRLGERIAWFCDVVGELQPILSRVTVGIERLALTPRAARSGALQRVAAELEEALTRREERELLAQLLEPGEEAIERPDGVQPPLTLRDLEAALLRLPTVAGQLHPHPYRAGIYRLASGGQVLAVTLDRRASEDSDEQPRFLTYGDELLPALVRPELGELPAYLLRLEDERGRVGYYRLDGDRAEALLTYADLVAATEQPGTRTVEARRAAAADFAARCAAELEAAQAIEARLQAVAHSALRERARAVLYEAAAIQRLLGQRRSVRELATQGYPWAPLVRLVDGGLDDERRLEEAVNELRQRSRKQLEGRFGDLQQEAHELVVRLAETPQNAVPSETTVSRARNAGG
ncbi:MAG: DEAD/DEAH box helicase [Thermomicrobium sp.]|nr:DEAD/DEAH box helicase [Thermomicrobium sp.]